MGPIPNTASISLATKTLLECHDCDLQTLSGIVEFLMWKRMVHKEQCERQNGTAMTTTQNPCLRTFLDGRKGELLLLRLFLKIVCIEASPAHYSPRIVMLQFNGVGLMPSPMIQPPQ
jgi:hypothetical protein